MKVCWLVGWLVGWSGRSGLVGRSGWLVGWSCWVFWRSITEKPFSDDLVDQLFSPTSNQVERLKGHLRDYVV